MKEFVIFNCIQVHFPAPAFPVQLGCMDQLIVVVQRDPGSLLPDAVYLSEVRNIWSAFMKFRGIAISGNIHIGSGLSVRIANIDGYWYSLTGIYSRRLIHFYGQFFVPVRNGIIFFVRLVIKDVLK